MMWFAREACFYAVDGVRGSLEWEDCENMLLPVPHIDIQREIVKEYNTVQNRINLNEQLIQKLEEPHRIIGSGLWSLNFPSTSLRANPMKMVNLTKAVVAR